MFPALQEVIWIWSISNGCTTLQKWLNISIFFHFNNGARSSDRSLRLHSLPQPQGHKAWALRVCVEVEKYRFLKSCYSSHKQHVPMFPPQSWFSLPSAAHLAVTHSFVGTSQWQHWAASPRGQPHSGLPVLPACDVMSTNVLPNI